MKYIKIYSPNDDQAKEEEEYDCKTKNEGEGENENEERGRRTRRILMIKIRTIQSRRINPQKMKIQKIQQTKNLLLSRGYNLTISLVVKK